MLYILTSLLRSMKEALRTDAAGLWGLVCRFFWALVKSVWYFCEERLWNSA